MTSYIVCGLLVMLVYGISRVFQVGRRPKSCPPGPPTLPILGNLHQIPNNNLHLQLQKWAKEYGPIYSLILGTQTLIILSSPEAIKELLDKRSNIYSSRPNLYISQNLISGGNRMVLMKYDERWRMIRKMCHSLLNVQAARTYVPYQLLESKQMLNDLLDTPDDFVNHMRRYSNSLTVSLLFGKRVPSYLDIDMLQLFEGFEKFSLATQRNSSALLDAYPVLQKLPTCLIPMISFAKQLHKDEIKLYLKHYVQVKEEIKNGIAKDSFSVEMARIQKDQGFDDEEAAYISGTLLEAGSDTTSSTMVGFIQAMACFPRVQSKAQAEIDHVVGSERLPTMEDANHLPYIRAMIKETLRWMPTTPTGGIPHAVTVDDEYNGYAIPKGAQLMNNVWAINMNESRYPNPREFRPERYEGDESTAAESAANPDPAKRDHFTFGAGRRICQGMHIAERSLFLGMSRVLWGFKISPKIRHGKCVPIDTEKLTQGFVCLPDTFECQIVPRDSTRAMVIREEWQTSKKEILDPETFQFIYDIAK